MALWRSKGARKDATRGTAPIEVRKSDALLFTGPGVTPGSATPLVTGTAGWTYNVGAAGFVSTRGASDGAHWYGNDGTTATPAVAVAPGAGLSRIDIIYVIHPAAGENADTISEPSFGVASGTAAASPVAPVLPTGALELARNTMASSATSTASAGNTITQTATKAQVRGVNRLIGYDKRGGDSAAFTTTETTILTVTATVTDGFVRMSLAGKLNSTVAGDVVTIRVRDNGAGGTVLLEEQWRMHTAGSPGVSDSIFDYAVLTPGVHVLYVTGVRTTGTGTITARANFRMVVDDGFDPR